MTEALPQFLREFRDTYEHLPYTRWPQIIECTQEEWDGFFFYLSKEVQEYYTRHNFRAVRFYADELVGDRKALSYRGIPVVVKQ